MALSERTVSKLREETLEAGGTLYEEDDDVVEADVTHTDEDDDPLTNVGDLDGDGDVDEDDRSLSEDLDEEKSEENS